MKNKDEIISSLQKENETLKTVISLLPGNIYWKDVNGYLMGCNNNVANIFNLDSPEKIVGKSNIDLMGPEMGQQINEIDYEVIKSKKDKSIEEHGFAADGTQAVYLTHK